MSRYFSSASCRPRPSPAINAHIASMSPLPLALTLASTIVTTAHRLALSDGLFGDRRSRRPKDKNVGDRCCLRRRADEVAFRARHLLSLKQSSFSRDARRRWRYWLRAARACHRRSAPPRRKRASPTIFRARITLEADTKACSMISSRRIRLNVGDIRPALFGVKPGPTRFSCIAHLIAGSTIMMRQ